MLFKCDADAAAAVRAVVEGRRVAIVGSGPGVLDNAPGMVDSHDVVVRVNNYKLSAAAGRRTDVFYSFFGGSIKKTAAHLRADGVRLCMAKCPNAQFMESAWHRRQGRMNGVDFRGIYRTRARWWFCPTYVPPLEEFMLCFSMLGGRVPTTGFSALWTVALFAPASIYLTGFDFFTSRIHNVNERWKPGDPSDPIRHTPEREREWLRAHGERLGVSMDQRLSHVMREAAHAPV